MSGKTSNRSDFRWLLVVAVLVAPGTGCAPEDLSDPWETLEPGLDLGRFSARGEADENAGIRVLRVDANRFELRLLNASAPDQGRSMSARDWCARNGLVAAINASMYQEDYRTSVSLMRTRDHVNNPRLSRHKSVLAFDRRSAEVPAARIIDLECEQFEDWESKYETFIQSIRMLSCEHENVWSRQQAAWSTTAIGIDRQGRLLLIHARPPFTTHDLIQLLVGLPLDLDRMMYAEGGPEAQLFVHGSDREYEFVGRFDTETADGDDAPYALPIPNVLGIARLDTPGD